MNESRGSGESPVPCFQEKPTNMIWNSEPQHNWPGGKYVGAICTTCGVSGFLHHKHGPSACWPHYQEGMAKAHLFKEQHLNLMIEEYGPHTPQSIDHFTRLTQGLSEKLCSPMLGPTE
jgi:hypothetical protein